MGMGGSGSVGAGVSASPMSSGGFASMAPPPSLSSAAAMVGTPGMPFLPTLAGQPPSSPAAAGGTGSGGIMTDGKYGTKAAVDAAVKNERARARELEKEEAKMNADELRLALRRERTHSSKLAADLAALRSMAVASQAEAEVHEEGRINCLMRRLEGLQQEKGRIIVELEREEEMLTNTLQKKLNEVRREKALLEQQIEREQSSHHDLKSRWSSISTSRSTKGNDGVVGGSKKEQE